MASLTPNVDDTHSDRQLCAGFLEIEDRQGHVVERVRITSVPVSVGRAYDNDVILADAYVCPYHLCLHIDEEGRGHARGIGGV